MRATPMIAALLLATPLLAAALSIGESYQGEGTYYGAGQTRAARAAGAAFPPARAG